MSLVTLPELAHDQEMTTGTLTLSTLKDGRKAIIIRTSDRLAFKSCRRKWAFSSHLKRNLGARALASPLWFGSAIHYALEDYHGYNKFGTPANAFMAYCIATAQNHLRELPSDAPALVEMGKAQMEYYDQMWLKDYGRKVDETYWWTNPATGIEEPQVEVNFEIPVPLEEYPHLADLAHRNGADCVLYRGTIDRVAIDSFGSLWVVEYKTAKRAETMHFQTDSQVSTYVWAAELIYERPVAGVIYQQFVKIVPQQPRINASTGRPSTAGNQSTSFPLYRQLLRKLYGSETRAPEANKNYLWDLARAESDDRDRYIQRERVHRNKYQSQAEAQKILLELEDMLNPDLPLYPNPTRDCSRMCSFLSACVGMDDGSDWEGELEARFASRDQAPDRMWRRRLPDPDVLARTIEAGVEIDLEELQKRELTEFERGQIAFATKEANALEEGWTPDPAPEPEYLEEGGFKMDLTTVTRS